MNNNFNNFKGNGHSGNGHRPRFRSKRDMYSKLIADYACKEANPVFVRCVDSSFLVFSLSSHRYSYTSLLCNSLY
jgi:hypothetical protein